MNILILSPVFPYPLNNGGKIRTYNIIKFLSRHNKVTLACLSSTRIGDDAPLREFCEEIICVERKEKTARDLLAFLCGKYPLNFVRFQSRPFEDTLRSLVQHRSFDIVLIESTLLWQYAELFRGIPVVLGTENVEYQIVEQIGGACRNPLKKLLYALEKRKLMEQEHRAWRECGLCFTVSDAERDIVSSYLCSSDKVVTAPNGVDLERFAFEPKANTDKRLLFLGGMDYLPNLDSARYFLQEIFPLIQAEMPGVTVDFVGRELGIIGALSGAPGVRLNENVPEVLTWFRNADALVVPLRFGAGTRLKVLEAMAAGVPIVSTSKGCEGTGTVHGVHLLIADDPAAFASETVRLLGDAVLRRSLAESARKLVEQKYSWESIVKGMDAAYRNLLRT